MLGGGASRNYSFPNTSGKGAIGSCRMRGNRDNFITDVDENVIIVEDHDTLEQEIGGSSVVGEGKKSLSIINIDDDESQFTDLSDLSGEDDGAIDSDDTQRTTPVSNCMPPSEDPSADDCGVVQEKRPAFKLSKCKNMYTNKSPPRNSYGLNSQSESDSESDSSDCEVIEGSSSELREQWNKARLKRKSNSYDKGSGLQDQVSPCSSQSDTQPSVKVGNGTKQYPDDPVCSRGKNLHFQEASSSYFPATDDGFISDIFNPWTHDVFTKADNFSQRSKPKSWKNSASHLKSDVSFSEQTCTGNCDFGCNECQGVNRFQNERFGSCGHSPRSIHRSNKKVIGTRNCFPHSKERIVGEHSFESTVVKPNLDSIKRPCVQDHDVEASLCKDQFLGGTHSSIPTSTFSMDEDLKFSKTTSSRNMCSDETQCEILGSEVKDKLCSTTPSDIEGHDPLNESISNSHEGNNSFVASCGDVISTVPNDIINERERLKETDEYKQAAKEEWEARQQQLKIQAEEVKRLKKRRKAETLRILDMEKRQKQRVEEVRETQRKDEENLNMKEHLRAEIRKQLYRLEITCTDMASLLRGLGIHVEGGFHPLSREVNAAYKRALLKFHPDRASRTDIRQQVESEEKFKLISRMKEKFLPP